MTNPLTTPLVRRQGRLDGKRGLPFAEDSAPPYELERIKARGRRAAARVMEKWRHRDAKQMALQGSATIAADAARQKLAIAERGFASVEAAAAAADLDSRSVLADLNRRLSHVDSEAESAWEPPSQQLPRENEATALLRQEAEDLEREIGRLSAELETSHRSDGISSFWYVLGMVILALAEYPLNFLGFRVLREQDLFTYLIALIPAVLLVGGAHVWPILTASPRAQGKQRQVAVVGVLLLALILGGLFVIRRAYIESRVPGGADASTSLASLSNTAAAFLALNLGVFSGALLFSYAYHDGRRRLEEKLRAKRAELGDIVEEVAESAADVEASELSRRELTGKRHAKASAERRDRFVGQVRAAIQVVTSQKEQHAANLELARRQCEELREAVAARSREASAIAARRSGEAAAVRARLLQLEGYWTSQLHAYCSANERARAKVFGVDSAVGRRPQGFAPEHTVFRIPREWDSEIEIVTRAG